MPLCTGVWRSLFVVNANSVDVYTVSDCQMYSTKNAMLFMSLDCRDTGWRLCGRGSWKHNYLLCDTCKLSFAHIIYCTSVRSIVMLLRVAPQRCENITFSVRFLLMIMNNEDFRLTNLQWQQFKDKIHYWTEKKFAIFSIPTFVLLKNCN